MSKRESVGRTVTVAAVLCVVCALVVAAAAVALRDMQAKNKALDIKKNILAAAGLMEDGIDVEAVFAERIKVKVVNLPEGTYNEEIDPMTYDPRKAAKDPDKSVVIDDDIAAIGRRAKHSPVYEVYDGDTLKQVVLPVHGKGLWSTMYGFLALEPDTRTVAGLGFYEHGETPGLGGEIENPKWRSTWTGKNVYDKDDVVVIDILKGMTDAGSPKIDMQVDGLSGATITANGVENMLHYWLSDHAFKAYLQKVRQRGVS